MKVYKSSFQYLGEKFKHTPVISIFVEEKDLQSATDRSKKIFKDYLVDSGYGNVEFSQEVIESSEQERQDHISLCELKYHQNHQMMKN